MVQWEAMHVVLIEPEIPQNTGNIVRLCANVGARLHLVRPLGFLLSDRYLRRAGLDYHRWIEVTVHDDWVACREALATHRWWLFTPAGSRRYDTASFAADDVLAFGSETSGIASERLAEFPAVQWLRLPMRPGQRSMNLANSVAVALFEAWRQQGFVGGI